MQSTLPQPGATVWIRGRRWRVATVRGDRQVAQLDVAGETGRRSFLYPFDRPIEAVDRIRPVRVRPQRARARLASLAGRTFGCRTLAAAVEAGVTILPHQLAPALAAISGVRRLLIADEVGLGKTIQAGLIAAEILRRDPSARVLVVVPAALAEQWLDELRQRFHLACMLADRIGLDSRAREGAFGDSPWTGTGIFVASLDFLKQPHVLDGLPARPWDLVVVDEAHTTSGHSDRHTAVHYLGRRARCLVLLTATPHSGDEDRFARLLSTGGLAGDQLIVFRRRRADLGVTGVRRTAWHYVAVSDAERRVFDALIRFQQVVLRAARRENLDEARLLLGVLTKRALSTMGALAVSIDRRLAWLSGTAGSEPRDGWVQARLDLGADDAEDIVSADDLPGLRARTGLDAGAERSWLERLGHLAVAAAASESKVRRVLRLISRTNEPVIVFTEFRDSLRILTNRLQLVRPIAILHGGMTAAERSDAINRFQTGAASALVATDVAGQGLNLQQRCRWVISLELPWNPVRLEQRIGRVDRIGQRGRVHLTLLVARHPAEAAMMAHLSRRELTATRAEVPMADARWTRLAGVAARSLESRRRLVRQWRGPELSGRPLWAHRTPAIRLVTHPRPVAVLVFSIPFVDRSGAVVEMHLAAVTVANVTRQSIDAAAHAAIKALVPRIHRVRRLAAATIAPGVELERTLSAAMRPVIAADVQPGLFDAAAIRDFESRRVLADELERQLQARLERLRLSAEVDAGRPVLEVAWLDGL
jgi:superfamily II DNA or RNA helicase